MAETKRAKVRKAVLPVTRFGHPIPAGHEGHPERDVAHRRRSLDPADRRGVRGQRHRGDHPRDGAREVLAGGSLRSRGRAGGPAGEARQDGGPGARAAAVGAGARDLGAAGGGARAGARRAVLARGRGRQAIAVVLGDDLLDADPPGVRQLLDVYERAGARASSASRRFRRGRSTCTASSRATASASASGSCRRLIEKPAPGTAPSRLAAIGRYVLPARSSRSSPRDAAGARRQKSSSPTAWRRCASGAGWHGVEMEGQRFDAGDRAGYVLAQLHWALKRKEIAADVRAGAMRILEDSKS